jgi:predicted ATPase/Tfp pilus assembly protein PilF
MSSTFSNSGGVATAPAHNLPRQATSFVGREQAVEDCLRFLRGARLLTLTGVGGSGKTRLALRVAERLLPDYPEGVWFVDLAPLTDPEHLPRAVAAGMGITEESGRSVQETLARQLAPRRALLILDNCEHLLEASAALAVALLQSAAGLRMIATSRETLGLRGEQTLIVPSLALPRSAMDPARARESEAVRLFAERAGLVDSDFALDDVNTPIIAEICEHLDGIPLAIELAAARVRVLSVAEIRARLEDRFRLLGGGRGSLPRHQTLLAAMQWSYDHLGAAEQELFRALSVFVGGWTLESAHRVCAAGRDEFEALDLLTGLVNKSLVVAEHSNEAEARYRFLETVRQYADALLAEPGERDAARRAHRDWFLSWAERAASHLTGADQVQWLDRMERETGNLRAALDQALSDGGDLGLAVRMADALQWLWVIRGYIREGRERLEAIAARADALEPTRSLASVLQGAGNMCYRLDDFEAAGAHYRRALALRERIGDTRGVAGSLGALGNVAQFQGRFAEALALFERSLAINRESGNRVWEAANLTCLGNCSRAAGALEDARRYLEQALALNREIGNRNGECFSLDGLGSLLLQIGDHAAARATLEQALAVEREVGNEHEEAVTLSNLARLAVRESDLALARRHYAEAILRMHRLGADFEVAGYLHGLATIAWRESRAEEAVRLWAFAESFRRAFESRIDPDFDPAEPSQNAAREALGAQRFDALWAEGARLSVDAAAALGSS